LSAAGSTVSGMGRCVDIITRHGIEVVEASPGAGGLSVVGLEAGSVEWGSLYRELSQEGCLAAARREGGLVRFILVPRSDKPRLGLALVLGAAVLVTLYVSGVFYVRGAPESARGPAWSPLAYLLGLLVPLLIHESGHYVMMKRAGVPSSVPIPLPAPPYPWFLGTFGSIILMRWPPPTLDSLALIGVAGPLAGYLAALPVAIWGLHASIVVPPGQAPPGTSAAPLVPLTLILLSAMAPGGGGMVILSPPAFASYIMFFVTFLNLMPIGQLDGGHIIRAALGARGHLIVSNVFIIALLIAGLYYPSLGGFAVVAILLYLLSRGRHPGPAMPEGRLGGKGLAAVLTYAALLILTLPVPTS
jgi:membrane-associated protease RseP (regulator of RpoE activity)